MLFGDDLSAGFVALSPRVHIGHGESVAPANVLLCAGQSAPEWVRAELVPDTLTKQFDTLLTALQVVSHRLSPKETATLSLTEAALLRALIVHHWRRLVLRFQMGRDASNMVLLASIANGDDRLSLPLMMLCG